jgi:hypothetical protein
MSDGSTLIPAGEDGASFIKDSAGAQIALYIDSLSRPWA